MKTGVLLTESSAYNGERISLLYVPQSGNKKTGDVASLWVIPTALLESRPTSDQTTARFVLDYLLKNGKDAAVCGPCPHRSVASGGQGTCYTHMTVLAKGLANMLRRLWRLLDEGQSIHLNLEAVEADVAKRDALRVCSYGDQGSLGPIGQWILHRLQERSKRVLAYTHSGQNPGRAMVSVEGLDAARREWEEKRRTFRVVAEESQIDSHHEVLCPSARVTCARCGLCDQNRQAKSIAIVAHNGNSAAEKKLKMLLRVS